MARQEGNKESSGINGASQAVAWCHWGEREREWARRIWGGEGREGSGEQRTIKIGKVSSESGDGILNRDHS